MENVWKHLLFLNSLFGSVSVVKPLSLETSSSSLPAPCSLWNCPSRLTPSCPSCSPLSPSGSWLLLATIPVFVSLPTPPRLVLSEVWLCSTVTGIFRSDLLISTTGWNTSFFFAVSPHLIVHCGERPNSSCLSLQRMHLASPRPPSLGSLTPQSTSCSCCCIGKS